MRFNLHVGCKLECCTKIIYLFLDHLKDVCILFELFLCLLPKHIKMTEIFLGNAIEMSLLNLFNCQEVQILSCKTLLKPCFLHIFIWYYTVFGLLRC